MDKREYRKTAYYRESIEILRTFKDIVLDGEMDRLLTYCFDDLKMVKGFSTPENEEIFDCDNLKISKAIYCILWGHIFDIKKGEIGNWDFKTEKCAFRGDTINSFNTLFGNDRYGQIAFRARNRKLDTDFYLWKDVIAFHREYHTIGNFILLPNNGDVNGNRVSSQVGDYFDLFLLDLYKYKQKKLENNKLDTILKQNAFYGREDVFLILKDEFFLDEFFDDQYNPKYIFGLENRSYKFFEYNRDKYKMFAKNYIEHSERIIFKRSSKMIDVLKTEISLFQ